MAEHWEKKKYKIISLTFSEKIPNIFKRGIENLPSRWTVVVENEADYIIDSNNEINLTYICFYICSCKTY